MLILKKFPQDFSADQWYFDDKSLPVFPPSIAILYVLSVQGESKRLRLGHAITQKPLVNSFVITFQNKLGSLTDVINARPDPGHASNQMDITFCSVGGSLNREGSVFSPANKMVVIGSGFGIKEKTDDGSIKLLVIF